MTNGHEAPQIQQPVFDGCAGQDQPVRCAQGAGDLGGLGAGILDVLAFVENHGQPAERHQALAQGRGAGCS